MKLYEISNDLLAIQELFESAVDENGEPRELNASESEFLKSCFENSKEQFEEKFDSYGKFMANLKAQAEEAEATKKAIKGEVDRLTARAKAYTNRRDAVKNYLYFNMKNIGLEKFKSSLFSAGIQSTQMSINSFGALNKVPEQFLKPREINTAAIKSAIKDGKIKVVDGDLFYLGEQLDGLKAEKSEVLVIR